MATLDFDSLANLLQDLSVSSTPEECRDPSALSNPLEVCRCLLAALLVELVECSPVDAIKSIQFPNNISNGDLSITLPRLCPGKVPAELSSELVDKFPRDHPIFDRPLPEGVHLRVFLKLEAVPRLVLPFIFDKKANYGAAPPSDDQKNLTLEFSSPNITTEFQGKHLRSTIIGGFVGRLYEILGWNVTRINYLGDWGKPIALLYVGWQRFGSEEAYQANPVRHLLDVYHKIEEEFKPEQAASRQVRDDLAKEGKDDGEAQIEIESKGIFAERNEAAKKLEDGDEEVTSFWRRIRGAIVDDYNHFYERLGVHFDEYSGESEVKTETMVEVEAMLRDKGISEESAGAWVVDMKKLGARAGHAVLRHRDGNTMYLLRDLAAVFERSRKYSFDKMVYVVANDNHSVHFVQLFKIIEALDKDLAGRLQHVKFSDLSKMASNLGKGYRPRDILDQCEEAVATLPEVYADKAALIGKSDQITKSLGISALLVQELSTRSASAHAFDTAALPSFRAGSGLNLQYWYSKIHAMLAGHEPMGALSDQDFEALAEDAPADLLRTLAQYPEVINATFNTLEPSGIVTCLSNVLDLLSYCFDEEEGPIKVTQDLAALLEATRIVLANGMKLLGLVPIADLPTERADTPITA